MGSYETVDSRPVHRGRVIRVRTDVVRMPGGATAERDVIEHPGAVMVVALDEQDRVFLLDQWRHPVGGYLTELPAGVLDRDDETPLDAAKRELFEEAALRAATWHTLLDLRVSPGAMNEIGRVFLARDLTVVPDEERFALGGAGEHEEADLATAWVPLDEAVDRVMAGRIVNAAAVAGLLAAAHVRDRSWAGLRPADLPWPPRRLDG